MVDIAKHISYWRDGAMEDLLVARNLYETYRGGIQMVESGIRTVVETYLKTLARNGVVVTRGIIFGSQVKGNAGVWSDIDLLIVSPKFDAVSGRDDINLLWRLAARTDSRIEPIPCGEKQWLEDDSSPIIEIARREGEVITPTPEPKAHKRV